jgi:I/LWEQ domain
VSQQLKFVLCHLCVLSCVDVAQDFKRLACKRDVVRNQQFTAEQVDTMMREQALNLEPSAIDDLPVWVVNLSPELLASASGLSDLIRELLSASVAAYKELVAQRVAGGTSVHTLSGDVVNVTDANAEYLVIAARLLVPSIKRLLKVVRNNDGDEAVVAAARVLKGATARLVSSCRAKLAPSSPSGQRLKTAANAVFFKTQNLADEVMWSADGAVPQQGGDCTTSLKARMENQHTLARKEIELEERRRRLITLRSTPGRLVSCTRTQVTQAHAHERTQMHTHQRTDTHAHKHMSAPHTYSITHPYTHIHTHTHTHTHGATCTYNTHTHTHAEHSHTHSLTQTKHTLMHPTPKFPTAYVFPPCSPDFPSCSH